MLVAVGPNKWTYVPFLWLTASTLSLGLQSGLLLAVPIPDEHAAVGQEIEGAIQVAVAEARWRR